MARMTPTIILLGTTDLELCVPHAWSDAAIVAYANAELPPADWALRRAGELSG